MSLLLKGFDLNSKYALYLTRRDLRILIGLLSGYAGLSRHLTLMKVRSDPICPLCQEEEERLLVISLDDTLSRFTLLVLYCMDYTDLGNILWPLLLKLAKAVVSSLSGSAVGPRGGLSAGLCLRATSTLKVR